ncbi:hypothetical protein AVEN_25158-1 [Araneus ventricosus]|uniref:Uncharacterized protein n=1 Tax=Araneus ventricosus TaxID=182803 RepID=A0A4Y2TZ49_ARAVE|nr:hypothetical protein AVEN_25158-1 [Araneus ventricosus]
MTIQIFYNLSPSTKILDSPLVSCQLSPVLSCELSPVVSCQLSLMVCCQLSSVVSWALLRGFDIVVTWKSRITIACSRHVLLPAVATVLGTDTPDSKYSAPFCHSPALSLFPHRLPATDDESKQFYVEK